MPTASPSCKILKRSHSPLTDLPKLDWDSLTDKFKRHLSCVAEGVHSTYLLYFVFAQMKRQGLSKHFNYSPRMKWLGGQKGIKHISKPSLPHLQWISSWNKLKIWINRWDLARATKSFLVINTQTTTSLEEQFNGKKLDTLHWHV